jgi:hypothetical protein
MKCRKTPRMISVTTRSDRRGVALVLTLIMLAVITIVTVIFLATARRNRSSTTVRIDQTTAEFAAESAYQHAAGKIVERALNDRSLLSMEFFVSHPRGYTYESNVFGQIIRPLEPNFIPRVINPTNRFAHNIDVFLDLNRNGLFDDPGTTNRPFGDPIWSGILDRPWFPHSKTNRFVARMAYLVLPVGKSLDLNTIHHDTARSAFNPTYGYMRNQGFGPWELNLAAFLHEFNPTLWDYSYTSVGGRPNTAGRAFEDAQSIVRYREGWPANAASVPVSQDFWQVYPSAALNNFPSPSIDVYSDGDQLGYPVGVDISRPDDDNGTPLKTSRWPGADTTNHFFHIQELFDYASGGQSNKVTYDFYQTLTNTLAGQPAGSAYYRMMAQLGTQTGSDFENRIHLNFADRHANIPGTNYSVTNFVAWDAAPELAVSFFTNVAQRIFLAQSNEFNPVGTNQLVLRSMLEIPVFPTNRYSSAIHRILQEAANIFDATRSNIYPSVFRPIFGTDASGRTTFIVGYTNDDRLSTLQAWLNNNTNGIPLIVGAKKGFPNFNEFTLRSDILVSRKLQFTRPDTAQGTRPNGTNQMYVLGISNYFGAEAWNSYDVERGAGAYPRQLRIQVTNFARASLTNSLGFQTNDVQYAAASMVIPPNTWNGGLLGTNAFRLPLNTNQVFLSNAVYVFNGNYFANVSTNAFETITGPDKFPLPDWVLTVSNRLAYWMVEPGQDRILDFVLLEDSHVVDLHRDLVGGINPYQGIGGVSSTISDLWRTNRTRPGGPTRGIDTQIEIAQGTRAISLAEWREFAQGGNLNENDRRAAIEGFRQFCGLSSLYNIPFQTNDSLAMQTPFNPAAKLAVLSTWQADDPLVHYHPEDLRIGLVTNHQYLKPIQVASNVAPSTLTYLNTRYSPWNGNPNGGNYPENGDFRIKDAGVNGSVDWAFPSNKLATVGLLGRVHRGTPWQTIYLKPDVAPMNQWTKQSLDGVFVPGRGTVSRSHPTNDWLLFDMFTTGLDERTGRGLVSINQTNMETWSALFSGILVLSNNVPFANLAEPRTYDEVFVRPFGDGDPATNGFFQIWTNIYNYQRARGRPLTSVGELIQNVPELTTRSPFLNQASSDQTMFGLDDFAYEQIPQQILPLLRVGQSRFVVYAYGQALKPERINPGSGEVENYQVTAEFATRSVIRVEGNPRDRVRVVVESFNILPPD